MSLTVVGSIAYDAVITPSGSRDRMLGGAATHFALAASFFDEVRVIGPVGEDFDDASLGGAAHARHDHRRRRAHRGRAHVLLEGRVPRRAQHARDARRPS